MARSVLIKWFCFRAGKDVFCEKPISKTDEGTAKCYEIAKKMERTLFCAFNRHVHVVNCFLILSQLDSMLPVVV